jgi:hypothetical protein
VIWGKGQFPLKGASRSLNPEVRLAICPDALYAAWDKYGENQEIGFPNTAYYLPIICSLMGAKIGKIKDVAPVMEIGKSLLPQKRGWKHDT